MLQLFYPTTYIITDEDFCLLIQLIAYIRVKFINKQAPASTYYTKTKDYKNCASPTSHSDLDLVLVSVADYCKYCLNDRMSMLHVPAQ